ncbi:MAG: copper resistance CopC family protein, partial [Angustibacter sp.]
MLVADHVLALRRACSTGGLVLLFAVLAGASPAHAHEELLSSSPRNGSIVGATQLLSLTFSNRILPTGYRLSLIGPKGPEPVFPSISGTILRTSQPQSLSAGDYQLLWRVVSEDGHPVSGNVTFTVAGPDGDSSAPARRPAPS